MVGAALPWLTFARQLFAGAGDELGGNSKSSASWLIVLRLLRFVRNRANWDFEGLARCNRAEVGWNGRLKRYSLHTDVCCYVRLSWCFAEEHLNIPKFLGQPDHRTPDSSVHGGNKYRNLKVITA